MCTTTAHTWPQPVTTATGNELAGVRCDCGKIVMSGNTRILGIELKGKA